MRFRHLPQEDRNAMRAILIAADKRQITEISIEEKPTELQAAVGGYIETAFSFDNEDTVYVNEEGLLQRPLGQHWFTITGGHQPFIGNGILIGHNEDGEAADAKSGLDEIQRAVTFLTLDEAVRIPPFKADDKPALKAGSPDAIAARWEASTRLARSLDQQNKDAIMAVLAKADIATVCVSFDGCGDSGQIEHVEVQGRTSSLPPDNVELGVVDDFNETTVATRPMPLAEAIETMVYRLLAREHGGWEDGEGAYGECTFDVHAGTIVLDFNARFTDVENFTHTY